VPDGDLSGASNNVGVLLRDAPRGDYTVETKVTLPLGDTTVRNYQQAGLVAYLNDDDYASLHTVAIWKTRQVEYARELSYQGQLQFGGVTVGTDRRVVHPFARGRWRRLLRLRRPLKRGFNSREGFAATRARPFTAPGWPQAIHFLGEHDLKENSVARTSQPGALVLCGCAWA
jgi:hypothetical protein